MNRLWATRLAAPAAFRLGTRAALRRGRGGRAGAAAPPAAPPPAPTTMPTTTAATTTATQPRPVFVEVESGDTLDQIALENDTTVEALLTLNEGVDPNALRVGQRLRVR